MKTSSFDLQTSRRVAYLVLTFCLPSRVCAHCMMNVEATALVVLVLSFTSPTVATSSEKGLMAGRPRFVLLDSFFMVTD